MIVKYMGTWRTLRANDILRQELALILETHAERNAGELITVTRVEASPDLQHAKVYISILPERRSKEIFMTLSRDIYEIQQKLNSRMRMRPVPKVEWAVEKNVLEHQKIDELLNKIEREKQ